MIPLVAGIMTGAMGSGHRDQQDRQVQDLPAGRRSCSSSRRWSRCRSSSTPTPRCGPWCRSWCCWAWASGFNFQPVILAVQNAVSPREMGVATSSVTFFRQMGGTLGVAAFLSILFTRLPTDIGDAVRVGGRAGPAGRRGAAELAAPARRRPVRHDRSSRTCRRAWSCRSRSGSRTRSTWCSSSPRPSWRSASSSCCSCRRSRCSDKSGIQALQEDDDASRHRGHAGRRGRPAGAGGGRLRSDVDRPAVGHAGGPAPLTGH